MASDHVTYVRNITDIEDKICDRAAEEGIEIAELTARTTAQFHEDIGALGRSGTDRRTARHPICLMR